MIVLLAVLVAQICVLGNPGGDQLAAGGPVAIIANSPVTVAELESRIGNRVISLRTQEYRLRRGVLEQIVAERVLALEADSRRMSVDELIRVEVTTQTPPVTQEEARAVYDSARDRFPGMTPEEVIPKLTATMLHQRQTMRRDEFVAQLCTKWAVRLQLRPPRIALDESDSPAHGPSDAPVTIVEFSDFQCPYCQRMARVVKELVSRYPRQVRLVARNYPLPIHPDAVLMAEAAACAHDQNRYWEMRDMLFSATSMTRSVIERYATQLKIDVPRFVACIESNERSSIWRRDVVDAERYGVSGTPTLFINGRFVAGLVPLESLVEIIEEELGGR